VNGLRRERIWLAVGTLLSLGVLVPLLVPLSPVFIHLFLPFPQLQDAQHWVGRVEIKTPHLVGNSIRYGQQFIVTPEGRFEFACGHYGHRHACYGYQSLNGAEGEVWFSRTHGALQWRFILAEGPGRGREDRVSYEDQRRILMSTFSYKRYVGKGLAALFVLLVIIWQVRLHLRKLKSTGSSGTSPVATGSEGGR
jgi:hypothetical protein